MNETKKEIDFYWIKYAFELSKKGDAHVLPNPCVGAVYIRDEKIVAEGWHKKCGGAHAERDANSKNVNLEGTTLYVSLEPCSHHGKTPPCVDYLIENKVKRVVYGLKDPGPGAGGVAILKNHNIEVEGPFRVEGMLNALEPFCCNSLHKKAYITAKWAMTLDGKIASKTKHSQWISSDSSRKNVHEIRTKVDGIMVGAGTVMNDEPSLDVRYGMTGKAPRPIIWDPKGVSFKMKIWYEKQRNRQPIIFVSDEGMSAKYPEYCTVIILKDFSKISEVLYQQECYHILVEGGAGLLGVLFDKKLVDQAIVYIAPKIIGGVNALSPVGGNGLNLMSEAMSLKEPQLDFFEKDICIRGLLNIYNPNTILGENDD